MSSPAPFDPTSAVALPPRVPSSAVAPVWKLEEGTLDRVECKEKEREVCCKDLRDPASERHLIDPDVVRDLVIGLADGLTVPFALTAVSFYPRYRRCGTDQERRDSRGWGVPISSLLLELQSSSPGPSLWESVCTTLYLLTVYFLMRRGL